jgi:uncharacterized protein (DUF924 family)
VKQGQISEHYMTRVDKILDFWFAQSEQAEYAQRRKVWFAKNPSFDQTIRTHFQTDYELAAAGKLRDWQETTQGCLALILLLDQFPRNMFRGEAQSFTTDSQALVIAQYAIAQGFDLELPPIQRMFIYLPFEHSEHLEHQDQAVQRIRALQMEDVTDYAFKHQAVIARFGRFPHRNKILGRANTPEEEEFLKQPGSSF